MNFPARAVYFYVDSGANGENFSFQIAAKLCVKAQQKAKKVAILCGDDAHADAMADFLWGFVADSFVTNCLANDKLAEFASVLLYVAPEKVRATDIMINLNLDEHIDYHNKIITIFEIVNNSEDALQAARKRYRLYKKYALNPQYKKITLKT